MNAYELPTALEIDGVKYRIRTDFRQILKIISALNDPDLDDRMKALVLYKILYIDPVPAQCLEKALKAGAEFLSAGTDGDRHSPKLMDWEQDAPLIIPAINKVAGKEVRAMDYLHWWTFIGYYMEIGEGQFSTVLSIRQKKLKKQKLEKYEQEFYRNNRSMIDLKKRISTEEREALDALVGWEE